jgi:hypothetical protein
MDEEFSTFEAAAFEKMAEGFDYYSANDLLEEIGGKEHNASAFARLFIQKHNLPEFFETREGDRGPIRHKNRYRDIGVVPAAVRDKFEELALEELLSGKKRATAGVIVAKLRWYTDVKGNNEYKFNDHWQPPLVRWFMERYECPGFFKTADQ